MYYFTFSLLICFALYEIDRQSKINYKKVLILLAVWLIIHDGLRWNIATDWMTYHTYFINCLVLQKSYFEIGYIWLNKIIRYFTDNYSVLLVIHAIVVYSLIIHSIRKYSLQPLFSLFIFYCLMLSYLGMNRQYLSLAIFFYSFKYIFKRKFFPFLLCMMMAFLFHRTALLFLPAYFLYNKISFKVMLAIFMLACIISFTNIINRIPSNWFYIFGDGIGHRMSTHVIINLQRNTLLFSILGILKRGIILIIIFIFGKKIKNKNDYFPFFVNVYFFGVIAYILLNNRSYQVIVGRGLMYFNIMEIFLIPYLLTIFKRGWLQKIVFVFITIYCFFIIQRGFSYYERLGGVDIFRPYKSALINSNYESK